MPSQRPMREKIIYTRPREIDAKGYEKIDERQVWVSPKGESVEIELRERFACDCRGERVKYRCSQCARLICDQCEHTGHARDSSPLCGLCSRVLVRSDGTQERLSHHDYQKRKWKRIRRSFFNALLSLFVEREN